MATDPSFAATVNNGAVALSGVDASPPVGTSAVVVLTAGTGGSKVEEVRVQATGTTVASLVFIWLYDGTSYRLFDTVVVRAITPSTTAPAYRALNSDFGSGSGTYTNLFLKSGWSLRASMSVAPTTGTMVVFGFGGDM